MKISKQYQDPNIYDPSADFTLSFTDYIKCYEKIITATRQDLSQNKNLIIQANLPFEMRPAQGQLASKCGVLMIHGLYESPFSMRDLGQYLVNHGYLVRAIVLPGHATVPGALLHVTYADWIKAVDYGMHTFLNEVDKLFIVGFSTGAVLGVYQHFMGHKLAGLVLLAPAFKVHLCTDFSIKWYPRLLAFTKYREWLKIEEETDYVKYSSVTFNSVLQIHNLGREVLSLARSKQMSCPMQMVVSTNDNIADATTSLDFFKQYANEKSALLLYSNKPQQSHDPRISVRSSYHPELNIMNLSHNGTHFSPDNPHYGRHGDYELASHIDVNRFVYEERLRAKFCLHDVLHKLGLSKYIYRQLFFNPDFNFMAEQIVRFLCGL